METASASSTTVLVVEDDDITVQVLKFFLEREGFHMVHAPDGRRAQEFVQTLVPPSLILLDCMLPHLNGLDLIPIIRAQQGWGQVPIIMLTADGTEHNTVMALEAGASDYIVKPFKPSELMARLKRFLKSHA